MMILYITAGLIGLVLLRAGTMKPEMQIERKISIQRPVTDVYNFVALLRNHQKFNKWTMTDPNVSIEYKGTDGEPGFSSHWSSNVKNVGEGIQTISSVTKDQRIDYDLTFIKPLPNTAKAWISLKPAGNATEVAWGFGGPRNFMGKLMQTLLNLEKMLGKDLDQSLLNLKNLLEK